MNIIDKIIYSYATFFSAFGPNLIIADAKPAPPKLVIKVCKTRISDQAPKATGPIDFAKYPIVKIIGILDRISPKLIK